MRNLPGVPGPSVPYRNIRPQPELAVEIAARDRVDVRSHAGVGRYRGQRRLDCFEECVESMPFTAESCPTAMKKWLGAPWANCVMAGNSLVVNQRGNKAPARAK